MKGFKNRLQLASVSVHSSMFSIHLIDPVLLSNCQEHGVLIPDLLKDGHGHVRHLVPGAVEVGPDSLLQVGPGLAVCPRHRDAVLVHPGPKL